MNNELWGQQISDPHNYLDQAEPVVTVGIHQGLGNPSEVSIPEIGGPAASGGGQPASTFGQGDPDALLGNKAGGDEGNGPKGAPSKPSFT